MVPHSRPDATTRNDFDRGRVFEVEGAYYATLSIHENALIEYQEAIFAYDEALRRAPDYVHTHNNRGIALTLFGVLQAKLAQHDDAVKSYKLALELCSSSLDIAPMISCPFVKSNLAKHHTQSNFPLKIRPRGTERANMKETYA